MTSKTTPAKHPPVNCRFLAASNLWSCPRCGRAHKLPEGSSSPRCDGVSFLVDIPLDKIGPRVGPPPPLTDAEYVKGQQLFTAFHALMPSKERAFFDSLDEMDQELARGYILAVLTGRDAFCALEPGAPLLELIAGELPDSLARAIQGRHA